jgi:tripartite-type tricarboxylate transporter receptor subunit TctC
MRNLSFVVALAAAVVSIGSARAQTYPAHPITLIVPFAAGGAVDVTARIVGEHMSRTLGQQVVIENVVGAGGTIAPTRAIRANPDGYTIVLGHLGTHSFAVALYPNLPYRPTSTFSRSGQSPPIRC